MNPSIQLSRGLIFVILAWLDESRLHLLSSTSFNGSFNYIGSQTSTYILISAMEEVISLLAGPSP